MKRSTSYAVVVLIFVISWIFLKISSDKLPEIVNWYTDVSPWYCLILFGCYCLAKLGFDLLTFNDYPLEIKKLEQDIAHAKSDLKKRGLK